MLRWIKEEWQFSRPGTKVLIILGFFVLAILSAAMIFILRNWRMTVDAGPETVRTESVLDSIPEEVRQEILTSRKSAQKAILNGYLNALGGVEHLNTLRSLRATGEVVFADGSVSRVVVIKKEGGMMRMSLGVAPSQIVMVVTPEEAWQSRWINGELEVQELPPRQTVSMRRSAHPISRLFMAMQNDWAIEYLGEDAFNFKMAHIFEVTVSPTEWFRFYIDPETFLEVGTEEWMKSPDGTIRVTRHLQSEHFTQDGLTLPGKIETLVNGEPSHTFIVQSVEINPGVLTSSFLPPEPGP